MIRTVEKYELLDELGHGGMATVYRARDTRLDRMVALKILHPHLRAAVEARSRFTREAKSVAKLRHPNILEIYDYSGEESEESYIAAELLSGPTLKEFGARNPDMPAEIAACIAVQVARALAAAHEHGIVHRDVKPENVLLSDEKRVKLTDFGIAQMLDTQSFTATGQILGSPGHMAPEQIETGVVDERSDIFALGTVLYYLACGRLPFTGRNPHQVLRRVMDVEYSEPLRVRPSIGAPLARIIERCLEKDPAARFQNARGLEAALLAMLAEVGVDDPDQAFMDYIDDPERVTGEIHAQVVTALTTMGAAKAEARDVPGAMDAFNRVLALDESNEQVLHLIQRLGRRNRRGAWLFVAIGVVGAALLAYALVPRGPTGDDRPRVRITDVDAGAEPVSDAGPTLAVVGADSGVAGDQGVGADGGDAAEADAGTRSGHGNGRRPPRDRGPRQVVFRPTPANVQISIDGGPLRAFGPSFRSATLTPGRHRFRLVGGADCCEDTTITRDIPAGDGSYELALRLNFRPARLYVIANAPASVRIGAGAGGRAATGRAREIMRVPMSRIQANRRITVVAPGHAAYTGIVRLRAGELMQHTVRLEVEAGGEPEGGGEE